MTIANLGIAVQSGQVKEGAVDLNQLERAAKGADAAVDQLAAGSRAASAAVGQMNTVVDAEAHFQERATATTRMHAAALQAEAQAAKMAGFQRRNLLFQLNDVGVSLASGMNPMMVLVQQGSQIATIYEGGVVPALRETAAMAGRAALAFAPVIGIVAALGIGVASLTREIQQAGNTSVNFGDVAMAAIQVPANAVYDYLEPAISGISDWWGREMDIFADQTGMIVNFLTQNFLAGFETIKAGVMTLPDAFIVAGEQAANGFISGIEWMVQRTLEGVNSITIGVQGLVDSLGGDFLREQLGWDISIPALVDPGAFKLGRADIGGTAAQGRIDAAGAGLSARTAEIYGTDYAGEWFGAIMDQSAANAANRLAGEVEGIGGAAKAANDNVRALADDGMGNLAQQTNAFADAARNAFSNMGTGLIDAFKKGGDVAGNVLDMIMGKVGQLGESLLNNGLNGLLDMGLNALMGAFGGFGMGGGIPGVSSITGSSGGFFPGFATGGDFTVGGYGGPDSQLRTLRLTPGETVSIRRPDQLPAANQDGLPPIYITNQMQVMPGATEEDGAAFARGVTRELRRQLPDAIDKYNKNPLRRAS